MLNQLMPICLLKDTRMFLKDQKNGVLLKQTKVVFIIGRKGLTYVKRPPFFDNLPDKPEGFKKINDARPLLILGDTVTTDHISPGT